MHTSSITPPSHNLQILKPSLYILAGIVLIPGMIVGIALIAGAGDLLGRLLLPLQLMGGEVISNMLSSMLRGVLINLGVVILILSLVISALLYALGRLTGQVALLEARLAHLETKT
jgi:hypothetical protein